MGTTVHNGRDIGRPRKDERVSEAVLCSCKRRGTKVSQRRNRQQKPCSGKAEETLEKNLEK